MTSTLITVGWREWVALPELGLAAIKAKVDTGARTSCLHAFVVEPYTKDNKEWVHFGIHPNQKDSETEIFCEAEVVDKRMVTDSGGHREERYIITTRLEIAGQHWPIEITLSNRDTMMFRMLLGRTAMENRIIVDPACSYATGKHHIKVTKHMRNVL